MSLSDLLTGAKPYAAAGIITAGVVGTVATGGLLPVIAGGIGGVGLFVSSILDSSTKIKAENIDAAKVEVQRLNIVAKNPNIPTGNTFDDLVTNFTKYLPYIIVGLALVLGVMFMSRSK